MFSSSTTLGNSVIRQETSTGWSNTGVDFNGAPAVGGTPFGVQIEGTVSQSSNTGDGYTATQLRATGYLASSTAAQAYLYGMFIDPLFDFSAGYGNDADGVFIPAPAIIGGYANLVSSLELGQPTAGPAGTSCSAALNIDMPNQSGNCPAGANRVWSIYNGSASSSFFAGNVQFGQFQVGGPQPVYPIQTGAGAFVTTGGVWTNASSRALKKDIRPLPADEAMETLAALAPVTFKYKIDDEAHVGFIAEDVPDLVATNGRKGLSAMDIVAVLAKVVQQQQAQLADQRKELDALKAQFGTERR